MYCGKPDQTSLNPVITGVIEREKYRIEKVVFEGQPKSMSRRTCICQSQAPAISRNHCATRALSGRQSQPGLPDPLQTLPAKDLPYWPLTHLVRESVCNTWMQRRLNRYTPTGEHDRFGWPRCLLVPAPHSLKPGTAYERSITSWAGRKSTRKR